jgi:hypothetical protein
MCALSTRVFLRCWRDCIDGPRSQTGASITHRAEFLFDLLSGLKITAKTLEDLMVRASLHCTRVLL